jgi:glucokinase
MPDTAVCLAVDIGGTKLAAGLVDRSGRVLTWERTATPASSDAEVVFAALSALIDSVRSAEGLRADRCGVGSGGPMTPGGETVSPINIPGWREFPLRSRLGQLTGLPVVVDNDAKALALAEGWMGAARGITDYISMVVSTGVGGGIVSGGRLVGGATGNAGHIGHVIVEPDGHLCGCGARGCLEAEASGTAIARITGAPAAEAGPEVVERTGRLVGRALASAANLLDLSLAVIGGSVALGFGDAFFQAARSELEERARLTYTRGARVIPTELGPTGGLIGAAGLAYGRPE